VFFAPKQTVLDATPTHHSTYVYGELSGGIPGTPITLHSHLGHTGGGFNYTKQYIDYNVGASLTWKNLRSTLRSSAPTSASRMRRRRRSPTRPARLRPSKPIARPRPWACSR
jgi:hypothetical protein